LGKEDGKEGTQCVQEKLRTKRGGGKSVQLLVVGCTLTEGPNKWRPEGQEDMSGKRGRIQNLLNE